jgi:hypothetical protein
MSGAKRPPSKGLLYDEERIGKVIDDRRIELGLEVKDVCAQMDWDKAEYSRKTRGQTPVWAAEYSKLHAILKGWTGFPFVPRRDGELLDAIGGGRLPEILHYLATHTPKK